MEGIHGAGKGDSYRQVNIDTYCKNYEKIFGKHKKKTKKLTKPRKRLK